MRRKPGRCVYALQDGLSTVSMKPRKDSDSQGHMDGSSSPHWPPAIQLQSLSRNKSPTLPPHTHTPDSWGQIPHSLYPILPLMPKERKVLLFHSVRCPEGQTHFLPSSKMIRQLGSGHWPSFTTFQLLGTGLSSPSLTFRA